jgi:hypothetical protein
MSFAAMTDLAEGLFLTAMLMQKVEKFYLPCRHMDTNRVQGGMAIYFALENINKK